VDFGLAAKWSFFATSHGKSPCDGVGGNIKRTVTRHNLHNPYKDQVTTPRELFMAAKEDSAIHFILISMDDMLTIRAFLKDRFGRAKTMKGTRIFHNFDPTGPSTVAAQTLSNDTEFMEKRLL
jgi:hypothetical protein